MLSRSGNLFILGGMPIFPKVYSVYVGGGLFYERGSFVTLCV